MSATYQIFPDRGVVLARLQGMVLMEDCLTTATAYARDPMARPGQHLLIDLRAMTGHESDYLNILAAMARLPDYLMRNGAEPLVVCLAGGAAQRQVAVALVRAIDAMPGAVARIARSETDALDILGLPERSLTDLMSGTARQE